MSYLARWADYRPVSVPAGITFPGSRGERPVSLLDGVSGNRSSLVAKRTANAFWEIGDLVERLRIKRAEGGAAPDAFVFQQKRAIGKPLQDSGVRDALHQAAEAEGCDFRGLGPHSFRRAQRH